MTSAAPAPAEPAQEEGYYAYLDQQTNNGVVFDQDLSSLDELPVRVLTKVERKARKAWRTVRRRIEKHYELKDPPTISDTDNLLLQRLLAPCLVVRAASSRRSKPNEPRADRRYPVTISPWSDFARGLAAFQPDSSPRIGSPRFSTLLSSVHAGNARVKKRDERQEEVFLVDLLNNTLYRENLTGEIVSSGPSVIGSPAIVTMGIEKDDESDDDKRDVQVICEFKSTHNLALPMTAGQVGTIYNQGYQDVYSTRLGIRDGWSRTCHPIGQLLGYMIDNGKRCGVLSSGTRSYFLESTSKLTRKSLK
jgi:hypothetical protein